MGPKNVKVKELILEPDVTFRFLVTYLTLNGVWDPDGDLDVLGVHGHANGHLNLLVDSHLADLSSDLAEAARVTVSVSVRRS